MRIADAIALIAVGGTRQGDGTLLIEDQLFDDFPERITVEDVTFDFSEEEEIDPETGYCLGHYFRRDESRPKV